jgi:hypothetical protein
MTEKHILLLAKLIKMRDTCRSFYGDKWKEKQREYLPFIEGCMKKENCDAIKAGMILSKPLEGRAVLCLWGTIMEMETAPRG